jgi:hypothetical protein
MNIVCAWPVNKDLGYENQKQIEMKARKRRMNKCKSETKRSVTEDEGGIYERHKSEKEGKNAKNKEKNT